jgi:hypothetical protein
MKFTDAAINKLTVPEGRKDRLVFDDECHSLGVYDLRELIRAKANFARKNETIELRWHKGVLVEERPISGIVGAIERRDCKHVFLHLLDKMKGEGRHVSHNPRAGNYAPKLFAQQPSRGRYKKPDFEAAMHTLFDSKKIVVGSYVGTNRHKHECIQRAEADPIGAVPERSERESTISEPAN